MDRGTKRDCIIWRTSDAGYNKNKPDYITPERCFHNLTSTFKDWEIIVVADNVKNSDVFRGFGHQVIDVDAGSNAESFNMCLNQAESMQDDTMVYFVENDYLHIPEANREATRPILEGVADYVTLYDHPDKYSDIPELGYPELTELVLLDRHWKYTESTTMTFLTTVKQIKEDVDVFRKYLINGHPHDYQIWQELIQDRKRRLLSPIPSLATHGEVEHLAPFIDWHNV